MKTKDKNILMSAEGEKDTLHVSEEKSNSHQKIHKTKG